MSSSTSSSAVSGQSYDSIGQSPNQLLNNFLSNMLGWYAFDISGLDGMILHPALDGPILNSAKMGGIQTSIGLGASALRNMYPSLRLNLF